MVTRFYLPSSGTAPGPTPLAAALWDITGSMTRRSLVTTKSNSALTTFSSAAEAVATSPQNVFGQRQWISDALDAGVVFSTTDTFSFVMRLLESNAGFNASLQLHIRIIDSTGATAKILYGGHSAANNATAGALGQEAATTTQATRIFNAVNLINNHTTSAGDRIVVEIGVRAENTVATSFTATFTCGDPSATADFALTAGLTTALDPWLEFSNDIFATQQEGRVNVVAEEAVIGVAAPEGQVNTVAQEAVVGVVTPEGQINAVVLEAIIGNEVIPGEWYVGAIPIR